MVVREVSRDEQIREDVMAELSWNPRVLPSEITIAVDRGIVTLTGTVESYVKRHAAEDAVLRVRGVRAVANEIEVRLPSASERSDVDLAAAAVAAIEGDAVLQAADIKVAVSSGWIVLEGTVDWSFEREEAERAVRNLWGIRGVSNRITVRARRILANLKREIEHALARSAHADARTIAVEVEDGKVTLTGAVRGPAEREEAKRVAWSAPGVTAVDDQLTVTDGSDPRR